MLLLRALRPSAVATTAVVLCLATGVGTREPKPPGHRIDQLSLRFHYDISDANGDPAGARTRRAVQPALEHINAWISAVGAAAGLADLDGDGLPAERCLVDPRDDSVTVAATPPHTGRFAPFPLLPAGLRYDPRTTAPMGCLPADLNEDGDNDVLVYFWGRPPVAYLRIPGTPLAAAGFTAVDVTGDPAAIWNSSAANALDLDGDGHLDLVLGNYFPDGARVLDTSAVDDPLMRMQSSMSRATNGGRNRILRMTGSHVDGAVSVPEYRESQALTDEQAGSWTLAVGAQDLDGDGRPELYFANDFGPDQLLVNESTPGRIRFREVHGRRDLSVPRSTVLGADSFKGMGVAFTDLNADGRPDILVSNITTAGGLQESNLAFVSTGTGPFGALAPYRNDSEALGLSRTGWAWDVKTADFDGDGVDEIIQAVGFVRGDQDRWAQLQELAMGNDMFLRYPWAWPNFRAGDDIAGHQRNPLLVRDGGGRYVDVAAAVGLTNHAVSRGIAIGDVDHDGRPDALIANQWGRSTFLHNTGPHRPYLGLRVLLPPTGPDRRPRPAIGAAVTVTGPDGRIQRRQLFPGNGHAGASAPELLFGLGPPAAAKSTVDGTGPVRVAVTWRDATGTHSLATVLDPGWHTVLLPP